MKGASEYLWKSLLTEFIGTYVLVFAGATFLSKYNGGLTGLIAISLVYGAVLMAVIYSMSWYSGTHLNPAVTLGFCVSGRMNWKLAIGYIITQIIAAILAVLTVSYFVGGMDNISTPTGSFYNVDNFKLIFMGAILTAFFVLAFLLVTKNPLMSSACGLAIGVAFAAVLFIGIPFIGDTINPAITIGTFTDDFPSRWILLVGPIIGAIVAGLVARFYGHKFGCSDALDSCGNVMKDDCGNKIKICKSEVVDKCGAPMKDCSGRKIVRDIYMRDIKDTHHQANLLSQAGKMLKSSGIHPDHLMQKASEMAEMVEDNI